MATDPKTASHGEPEFSVCDLSDEHPDLPVLLPGLRCYGGRTRVWGQVQTVVAPLDNTLVKKLAHEAGEGRVLVVAAGGFDANCAVVGDLIAEQAMQNGWNAFLVDGAVRDADVLQTMNIGVYARFTVPRKSKRLGDGAQDVALPFFGVRVKPGDFIYGDETGFLVSPQSLI